jgi:DNA-binding PadR family transcriptional regulator
MSDADTSCDLPAELLIRIGDERLSSHEIATRLASDAGTPTAGREAPLLPALHRLESDGKLRAGREPDSAGKVRRRYRTP